MREPNGQKDGTDVHPAARGLGALPVETLALMRGTAWAFALAFAAITVVSRRYLFIVPVAFSVAITLCLAAAAWISARQGAR